MHQYRSVFHLLLEAGISDSWTNNLWLLCAFNLSSCHASSIFLSTCPIFKLYSYFTKLTYIPQLKICLHCIWCTLLCEIMPSDLSLSKIHKETIFLNSVGCSCHQTQGQGGQSECWSGVFQVQFNTDHYLIQNMEERWKTASCKGPIPGK